MESGWEIDKTCTRSPPRMRMNLTIPAGKYGGVRRSRIPTPQNCPIPSAERFRLTAPAPGWCDSAIGWQPVKQRFQWRPAKIDETMDRVAFTTTQVRRLPRLELRELWSSAGVRHSNFHFVSVTPQLTPWAFPVSRTSALTPTPSADREGEPDSMRVRVVSDEFASVAPASSSTIGQIHGLSTNMNITATDQKMMARCNELARRGGKQGEYPFGSLLARGDAIVAEATNQVFKDTDESCHAEIIAIALARQTLGRKSLRECTLYSTVEPCAMCSFCIRAAGIGRVVYSLRSPVMGGISRWDILRDKTLPRRIP